MKDISGSIAASMLVLCVGSVASAEKPQEAKCQRVVYSVADLVVPVKAHEEVIDGSIVTFGDCAPLIGQLVNQQTTELPKTESGPSLEEWLIRFITSTIAPDTWSDVGGEGTIEYYPLGLALIVNQTADVQEQIEDVLAAVRKLSRAMAFKCKLVEVGKDGKTHKKVLPRIIVWAGQPVTIAVGGAECKPDDKSCALVGITLRVCTAQQKDATVALRLEYQKSERQRVPAFDLDGQPVVAFSYWDVETVEATPKVTPDKPARVPLACDAEGNPRLWLVLTVYDATYDVETLEMQRQLPGIPQW